MEIDAYIIPTYKCNLNCKFCFAGDFINVGKDHKWDEAVFDEFFEEARTHNAKYSITVGGGEPLLNIDFLSALYQYVVSKNLNGNVERINIVTNGVFLKNILKIPAPKGFFTINLSLHGFEKSHEFLVEKTGIWKNIIIDSYELLKQGYKFDVGMVVNQINIKEAPKLIDFLYQMGFKQFHIIFYHYIGNAVKNQEYLFLDFFGKHEPIISELQNWIEQKKQEDITVNVVNNFPFCKFQSGGTFEKDIQREDSNYFFKIRKGYYSKTYKELPGKLEYGETDDFYFSDFEKLIDENIKTIEFMDKCRDCTHKRKCNLVLDTIDAIYYKNIYNLPTKSSTYFNEVKSARN